MKNKWFIYLFLKEIYAMKVLKKKMIQVKKQEKHTKDERQILEKIEHPFVIKLHFAFQTKAKLYMVMDFM